MRLLAVNSMINNRDYFQTLCKILHYSFEEQLKRTAMNTIWGGEVQIQALSIALSHPIYSYQRWARFGFFKISTEPKPKCVKPNRTGTERFLRTSEPNRTETETFQTEPNRTEPKKKVFYNSIRDFRNYLIFVITCSCNFKRMSFNTWVP